MILFEFIDDVKKSKNHLEHPEDYVLLYGTSGAKRAIDALLACINNTGNLSIKYDGYPALVFGRNVDGVLVVADKHMFTKRDGSGRVTSLEDFIQYDVNRGSNRGDLYDKLKILWPRLERVVPKDTRGYFWGDLLYVGQLVEKNNTYFFSPNTVTYSVSANSEIGRKIKNSVGGIVLHQYYSDFDSDPVPLSDLSMLNTDVQSTQLLIIDSNVSAGTSLKKPVQLVNNCYNILKQYGSDIDDFLDASKTSQYNIRGLGSLLQRYVNSRVRGESRDFISWLSNSKYSDSAVGLTGNSGYLVKNNHGLTALFALFDAISLLKNNIITQCDSVIQHDIVGYINGVRSGEGYVYSDSNGTFKLVNRQTFSRANFANDKK